MIEWFFVLVAKLFQFIYDELCSKGNIASIIIEIADSMNSVLSLNGTKVIF